MSFDPGFFGFSDPRKKTREKAEILILRDPKGWIAEAVLERAPGMKE